MRTFKITCSVLVALLIVVFLTLKLLWFFQPKQKVNFYILDKTVTQTSCPEHSSFVWLLNNLRIVGPDNKPYNTKTDYWGFYPINIKKELFDFKSVRINEVDVFASAYDAAYYTDCYGVFSFEWYKNFKSRNIPSSKVYGGLNQNDYLLLRRMKENGKLIIGEYNMFNMPTNALIRNKAEELFNLSWSGWSGKCYFTLDTNKKQGPAEWMAKLYESQHLREWPADKQGIVLINNDGIIDVLVLDQSITKLVPEIITTDEARKQYNLPETTGYTNWFEFVTAGNGAVVSASFQLEVTESGAKQLADMGLTANFPAIIKARANEPTYYFAADFAENPNCTIGAKLHSGMFLNKLFKGNKYEKAFFSKFYAPLIENIINQYQETRSTK